MRRHSKLLNQWHEGQHEGVRVLFRISIIQVKVSEQREAAFETEMSERPRAVHYHRCIIYAHILYAS